MGLPASISPLAESTLITADILIFTKYHLKLIASQWLLAVLHTLYVLWLP